MPPTAKLFLFLGSLSSLAAVALGAFGAHAMKGKLSNEMMSIYQTGVQYHFYHALGLFIVAFAATHLSSGLVKWSGWLMFSGILVFSGSLYALSLTSIRILGAITPIGGVAFIVAWLLLAVAVWR